MASVSGRFVGGIHTKKGWIACLYVGSGHFLWGRFTVVDEETETAVMSIAATDTSKLVYGRAYPYLDAYWGERAELVYDQSRIWLRREFHPRDAIRGDELIHGGWEHEHCSICWEKIAEYAQPLGWCDQNHHWLCEACHEQYVVPKSIDFISTNKNV